MTVATSRYIDFDNMAALLAKAKANGIRKPFTVEFLRAGAFGNPHDWLSYAPSEVPAPRTYEEAEAFAKANIGTGRARIRIRTYSKARDHGVTVAEFFPA